MGECLSLLLMKFVNNSGSKQQKDDEEKQLKKETPKTYGLLEPQGQHFEQINQLNNDLSYSKDKIKEYEQLLQQREETINNLTIRLSKEMSAKVAADESSVENISIKARPMNVTEEYQLACSQEWLTAKTELDNYLEGGMRSECTVLALLCDIIKAAERSTCNQFEKKQEAMRHFLVEYGNPKPQDHKISASIKVPPEVNNVLIDYLRNLSDEADLDQVEEATKTDLEKVPEGGISQKKYLDLWLKRKGESSLDTYVSKMVKITWKMAIQRPPMTFQSSEAWLGEKFQELQWNSEPDVSDPAIVEVYPMLYHNTALMAKGKVLLVSKDKLE